MNGHTFAEALRHGRRVYGTCILSPSPQWPPTLQGAGLDFVFIDTEHIALDRAQLSWMCRTYAAMEIAPVVRIPCPDAIQAAIAVDAGAAAVIAPYVESADQVRALVGAVKGGPIKGERLQESLAGRALLEPVLAHYIQRRNAGHSVIVNIESVPAMRALDSILAVSGIDAILIGPHDLSCSLGIPEAYSAPQFDEAVRDIITRARAAGVSAGYHFWGDLEREARWARYGANLIIHSSDLTLFSAALRGDLTALRARLGDAPFPAPAAPDTMV